MVEIRAAVQDNDRLSLSDHAYIERAVTDLNATLGWIQFLVGLRSR